MVDTGQRNLDGKLHPDDPKHPDRVYQKLLMTILNQGVNREDRTGVGTYSIFGYQMRFDLRNDFPLLTTKKLWWKAIVEELLWFLSGSTNVRPLQEKGISIWNEWHDENGALGPVYGKAWRRWEDIDFVEPKTFVRPDVTLTPGLVAGVGTCNSRIGNEDLYSIWNEMLHRCYDPTRKHYAEYGGRGVHVHERWFVFENFVEDVKKLPRWHLRACFPNEYTLDKDYYLSNRYGPDTCIWSSIKEQRINTRRSKGPIRVTRPNGHSFLTMDIGGMCDDYGLDTSIVYKCIRGERTQHKGYSFSAMGEVEGKVARLKLIDQIAEVIAQIRTNPESRRLIVSAWNPTEVPRAALPPCHTLFQFYVSKRDGVRELSCHLYQRSGDVFLGVPYNIASYALLTHMIAHLTGLHVGDFVHTLGDAHIYKNHLPQVQEQLSRRPFYAPDVMLDPGVETLEQFTREHIALLDYEAHPAIKADIAV